MFEVYEDTPTDWNIATKGVLDRLGVSYDDYMLILQGRAKAAVTITPIKWTPAPGCAQ